MNAELISNLGITDEQIAAAREMKARGEGALIIGIELGLDQHYRPVEFNTMINRLDIFESGPQKSKLVERLLESPSDPREVEMIELLTKTNWHNFLPKRAIDKWTEDGDYLGPLVEVSHIDLNPTSRVLSANVEFNGKNAQVYFNLSESRRIIGKWSAGVRRGARSDYVYSISAERAVKDLMKSLLSAIS